MNAASMLLISPANMWSLGKAVSGTVDSDYQAAWLVDGRPGYPVRATGAGSPSSLDLTMSGASGSINIAVVGNHNLIVPVTFSGGISAVVTPEATRPPNGIPLNPFTILPSTATGVTSVEMSVSGNDEAEIIGEVVLGTYTEFTPTTIESADYQEHDFARPKGGEFLSVPPYNPRLKARTHRGSQYYSTADRDALIAIFEAQLAGAYPIVLILDPDVSDAWFVQMTTCSYKAFPKSRDLWQVAYEFVECPRSRW